MRARHAILLLGLIAALPACAPAQNPAPAKWADTIRKEIDAANIAGDSIRLRSARALAERVLVAYPGDWLILHYQGYAALSEASLAQGRGGPTTTLLGQARDALERSDAKHPMGETSVLLASVYGQMIGADPSQAMSLGMLSQQQGDRAVSLAPTNPRVWLIKGMNAMFTPPEYGGGLSIAEEHLNTAIKLFDKDAPNPGEPAWGRAQAHAWLGILHQRNGDKARAAADFTKALEIAPEYSWVKYVLLPSVQK
jgi:tetratricopeptide (TPR) repeat protein